MVKNGWPCGHLESKLQRRARLGAMNPFSFCSADWKVGFYGATVFMGKPPFTIAHASEP